MKAQDIFARSEKLLTEHHAKFGTADITITEVNSRRLENKPDIRKPYEYVSNVDRTPFIKTVRSLLNQLQKTGKLQCHIISSRSMAFGYKLELFALAFAPNYCGDKRGITETEWNQLVETLQQHLFSLLGQDALLYAEPYSTTKKFQLRFSTYVMRS